MRIIDLDPQNFVKLSNNHCAQLLGGCCAQADDDPETGEENSGSTTDPNTGTGG